MSDKDGVRMWMRKKDASLYPVSEMDFDLLAQHSNGAVLIVSLHQPRNEAQHKAYRAFLRLIANATGTDEEAWHWEFRMAAGFFNDLVAWDGGVYRRPRSSKAFDAVEMNHLFRTAERIVAEHGIDVEELKKEARAYAGLPKPLED